MLTTRQRRIAILVAIGATIALTVEVVGLYRLTLQPMDTVAHAGAGLAIGAVVLLASRSLPRGHRLAAVAIATLTVAVGWEIAEVSLAGYAGYIELGPVDTAVDVLATTAGGVLAVLLARAR